MFPSRRKYRQYRRVIVLAGAGMSADLGTPVYWTGDNATYGGPVTPYGYTPLQHAHAWLFDADPIAQTRYHRAQYEKLWSIDSASSHYGDLLRFCQEREYIVATTNIDSAFTHAGFARDRVFEVHGSYALWQCTKHYDHGLWTPRQALVCPQCAGTARPNALFFDDWAYMPSPDNVRSQQAYNEFVANSSPSDTLVLEIGVGNTVPRLAAEAELLVRNGYHVVRVNPNPSDDDPAYAEVLHQTAAKFCSGLH